MSGVLRLANTGGSNGRSTIVAAASSDATFTLPSAGGTILTTDFDTVGDITWNGSNINITNADLNVNSGQLFVDESTGFVGIGTTTPACKLTVRDTVVGGSALLQVNNEVVNNYGGLHIELGEIDRECRFRTLYGSSFFTFHTEPNIGGPVERVRIDSVGNVGIGDTNPDSNLVVKDSNNDVELKLVANNDISQSRLLFADSTEVDGVITYNHNDRKLFIGAGTSTPTDADITVDSSGNVGIGTDNPAQLLELRDTDDVYIRLSKTGSNGVCLGSETQLSVLASDGDLVFRTGGSGTPSNIERIRLRNNGYLEFNPNDIDLAGYNLHRGYGSARPAQVFGNGNYLTDGMPGYLALISPTNTYVDGSNLGTIEWDIGEDVGLGNSSLKAVITCAADGSSSETTGINGGAGGKIGFQLKPNNVNTLPVLRFQVDSNGVLDVRTQETRGIEVAQQNGAGTSAYLFRGGHSSTGFRLFTSSFQVFTNGNVENTNNSYTGISDSKLKENIVDAKSQWEDIKALRLVNYNFKEETGHETHKQLGVIAQEIEKISPALITETEDVEKIVVPVLDKKGVAVVNEDGETQTLVKERKTGETTKSIKYSVLYLKAVGALQEAITRIEALEAEVSRLRSN